MKVYISGGKRDVLLNGKPMQDVEWADEETGEICLYAHDANGQRLPFDQPDAARFVMCQGTVRLSEVDKNAPTTQGPSPEYAPWGNYDGCGPCFQVSMADLNIQLATEPWVEGQSICEAMRAFQNQVIDGIISVPQVPAKDLGNTGLSIFEPEV